MAEISSFALQYSHVNFAKLKASPYDLIVTEGDPVPDGDPHPAIGPSAVAQLQSQGRTVVGYVDLSVTDDARSYWDPAWTSDGTDTGDLTAEAPSWLQGQPQNDFGYVVKYWDPAWQQIVIGQAVYLVEHGFDGVFLDDVGSHYFLHGKPGQPDTATLADDMIDLVAAVNAAIKAVNPDAYVVVNGDPYIGTWATGGLGGAEEQKFLAAIDAMLLENQSAQTLADAVSNIGGSAKLLALFSAGSEQDKLDAAMHAYELGIAPYVAPDNGYDALGKFVNPGTAGDDTLSGGDGPNQLSGLGGNDEIHGARGNDVLSGNNGNDTLTGDAGNDTLNGGHGRDLLAGNNGADIFAYTAVNDSTGIDFDTVQGFDANFDGFALWFSVEAIDAKVAHGRLSDAAFVHDLKHTIGAGALAAHDAVLFVPASGDRAGETFLVIDANGVAGYQSQADLVIQLDGAANLAHLTADSFS